MTFRPTMSVLIRLLCPVAAWFWLGAPAQGQAPAEVDGPVVKNSSVGYIDSAIPTSQIRFRYDTAYRFPTPSRAEFFYAKGGVGNPGLPLPESNVDYQEATGYLEWAVQPWLSGFVETPVRFLNPDLNANAAGFSDINAGFKAVFLDTLDTVLTFQLRAYAPTGDARRGLGNHHVSLEPALLAFHSPTDKIRLEGELRYWAPIGGTDFAGDILRYGVGVSYGDRNSGEFWVTPVVELVGWSILNGKEQLMPQPNYALVRDAGGDTIVNVKAGFRFGLGDRVDFYTGYGRALTGDTWYREIWRMEMRWRF